jgi:hypothetical protein
MNAATADRFSVPASNPVAASQEALEAWGRRRLRRGESSAAVGERARLQTLRGAWEKWGQIDPLWAALTAPDMTDRRWDAKEFLQAGEREQQRSISAGCRYPARRLTVGRA